MVFSKRFPKQTEGSTYPKWVEVKLTDEEEKEVEHHAKEDHIKLFKECIEDAEKIAIDRNLKAYQTDIITMASSLFDKRASHLVFMKENKAKKKFDEL